MGRKNHRKNSDYFFVQGVDFLPAELYNMVKSKGRDVQWQNKKPGLWQGFPARWS